MNFQPILTLYYQGSVFSDAVSAQAFMQGSVSLTSMWTTLSPTDCTSTVGAPCTIIIFTATNGDEVLYSVAQVNYCVIENGYEGDPNLIAQNSATVAQAAASTFGVGIVEAQAACSGSSPVPVPQPANPPPPATSTPTPTAAPTSTSTPTATSTSVSFTIDRVSVHKGASDSGKALSRVKASQAVYVFIDWTLKSGPANVKPEYAFTAKHKGHMVARGAFTGTLSSYPPGGYFSAFPTKFKRIGAYTISGSVTFEGQTEHKTAKIRVVK